MDLDAAKELAKETNRPLFLLFTGTAWCPYCKALMPHLESLVLQHDPARFEILAITLGEDGDPAAFLRKHGYDFTLLPDGDEVAAGTDPNDAFDFPGAPNVPLLPGVGVGLLGAALTWVGARRLRGGAPA